MNEIRTSIIYALMTAVVLPLITMAINVLIKWLRQKTKSAKLADCLTVVSGIVMKAVQETAQTYVRTRKDSGSFDNNAQKEALEKTKSTILAQLPGEMKNILSDLHGDLDIWLTTQIEASIISQKTIS